MERIASFCVDHTRLERGMYLSRQDGDVLTWDIRMKKPNQGDYLTTAAAHTLEHLFATYARNSAVKNGVIYVGPMVPPHTSAGAARRTLPKMERTARGERCEKTVSLPPRLLNSCKTSRTTWVRLPSSPSSRLSRSQSTRVDARESFMCFSS